MDARDLILNFKRWVVIGDVANESKYASRILKKFKISGYEVAGVHPKGEMGIYKSLKEVEFKIEAIDLCINPRDGLKYLKEAKELNINKVLIQPGAQSKEIFEFCNENGIEAIEGCALIELDKLEL